MNTATIVASNFVATLPSALTIAGLGDFDANGKADILLRNAAGDVVTWMMNNFAIGTQTTILPAMP